MSSSSPSRWTGAIDPVGIGFALLAGIGWGAYILLTQRVGDRFSGITGLSITVPVAAVTAAIVGVPQAAGHLTPGILAAAVGLGLLHPVITFALEMLALRRMTTTAFGTLMAVEPAIGAVLGLLVLHQTPTVLQLLGILLVVTAGAAAQRGGRRDTLEPAETPPQGRPPRIAAFATDWASAEVLALFTTTRPPRSCRRRQNQVGRSLLHRRQAAAPESRVDPRPCDQLRAIPPMSCAPSTRETPL